MTEVAPLKRLAAINASALAEATAPDALIKYADLASVDSATGSVSASEMPFAETPSRARRLVRVGDTLMPTLVNSRSWQSTRPLFVSEELEQTVFSTGFFSSSPNLNLAPRFLYYVLGSRPALSYLEARAIGVTMIAFSQEVFGSLPVPVPPLERQHEIATFLDAETKRIDALIEKKGRLVEMLSLRRFAAIDAALGARSGESLPLRRVVDQFVDYRGATPEKAASGVPLVTATNVSDGQLDLSLGEQFVSEATYAEWMRRGFPAVGDVLLTTEAPLGEVAMIDDPRVALAQRLMLLKPNPKRITAEFLYTSLRSPRVQADLLSRSSGSTVSGIRADRLREVRVHVPNLHDQTWIVTMSQETEHEYRRGRALLERQIALLADRRQALITAAVAGELDLAEAV